MVWPVLAAAAIGAAASIYGARKQAKAAGQAGEISAAQYGQTREDLMPWQRAGQMSLQELMYRMGLGGRGTAPTREQFTTAAKPGPRIQNTPNMGQWQQGLSIPGTFDQAGYDQAMGEFNAQPQGEDYGSLLKPFSLADFEQSPAYQFNLQEGEKAINKGAAARGNYYAPQTLQDLGKFQQGLASNEFQNAYGNYQTNMNNIWNRLYGLSESGRGAATQIGDLGARSAGQQGEAAMGAGNVRAAGAVGAASAIGGGVGDYYNYQLMQQLLNRPAYGGGGGGAYDWANYNQR